MSYGYYPGCSLESTGVEFDISLKAVFGRLGLELKEIKGLGPKAMKEIGNRNGLSGMIAPVRPSRKCDYPLTPIERYIEWIKPESELPFDPWLRVHARSGAVIIKPCQTAMRIEEDRNS